MDGHQCIIQGIRGWLLPPAATPGLSASFSKHAHSLGGQIDGSKQAGSRAMHAIGFKKNPRHHGR